MSDLVGNHEDRFSCEAAHISACLCAISFFPFQCAILNALILILVSVTLTWHTVHKLSGSCLGQRASLCPLMSAGVGKGYINTEGCHDNGNDGVLSA